MRYELCVCHLVEGDCALFLHDGGALLAQHGPRHMDT